MATEKKKDEEVGYNYTAQDQIWKDHCTQEMKKAEIWEHNWSFLKQSYKEIIKDDMDNLVDKNRPKAELPFHMRVQPATPKSKYILVKPSHTSYPKTTSGEVGWRSAHKDLQLELFGKSRFAKGSILKQLNWPAEAIG